MKKIFTILAVICAMNAGELQAQEMENGMSLFNVAFGFTPGWGINVSYDYGIIDTWGPGVLTIGAYTGYGMRWKRYSIMKIKHHVNETAFTFAPRVTYRYSVESSFEIFGTLMFGAAFFSYSTLFDNASSSYFTTTAGCRYSFNDNFAAFAEIGYSETSCLNIGLCYSF